MALAVCEFAHLPGPWGSIPDGPDDFEGARGPGPLGRNRAAGDLSAQGSGGYRKKWLTRRPPFFSLLIAVVGLKMVINENRRNQTAVCVGSPVSHKS